MDKNDTLPYSKFHCIECNPPEFPAIYIYPFSHLYFGDFIRYLIKEVENAAFIDIEDGVPFVKWLYDELSYLVDERAVLKHFEWPEQKVDTLRKDAFGYCDLKKLESEASSFGDDPQ
ncbi:hypothetical protein LguiB_006054 [Lonicera macranthoides]